MSRSDTLTVAGTTGATGKAGERAGTGRRLRGRRRPGLGCTMIGGLGVLLLSPTLVTVASQLRPEPSPAAVRPAGRPRSSGWTRIALVLSGVAATGSLVYSAPITPWNRSAALSAPTAGDAPGLAPGADIGHDPDGNYGGIVRSEEGTVLVDATPATTGLNTIAVTMLGPDGAPVEVEQWSATATLTGRDDVVIPLMSVGEGVAAADAQLPTVGKWTFTITTRVAGAEPVSFTHVIPIAPHD